MPTLPAPNLLGAAASGLCAVHCALTPFLLAARPALDMAAHATGHGHDHGHEHGVGWALFDYAFLAVSFVAVYYSVREAHASWLRWGLWVAWAVFAVGIASESVGPPFGKTFMYSGSAALVGLHLWGFRQLRERDVRVDLA